jgi:SAM-dependent methyltransferase
MEPEISFEPVKQMTRMMWSLGDYRPLSKLLEEPAEQLVDACGIGAGREVLDVAAGDGNCAVAAARRGAEVLASDLTPALVEIGRVRTATEGLPVEWMEADVEDLPFDDERFDVVTSVFGAIFAPRPELAAKEMFRVLRPGGILGMANWVPKSFSERMMDVVSKYSPPPPVELPSPFRWGEEAIVRALFGARARSVRFERRVLKWEFDSIQAMRSVFESHGGAVMAKRMLPPDVYEAQATALEALVRQVNEGTKGRVVISNEYIQVVAVKS